MPRDFLCADPSEKRYHAEALFSNIWVKNNTAQRFQFKPAYQVIANLPENPSIAELCAGQDSNLHALTGATTSR